MKDFLKSMLCGEIVSTMAWGEGPGHERKVPEEFYGMSVG